MEKEDAHPTPPPLPLPPCAAEYIAQVVRKVRYRKKVRRDIQAELTAHFEDELRNCTSDAERDARAHRLIETFGDPKLLAVLCRRAKKRCRPLWARAFSAVLRVTGIFLLVFTPYAIWFVRGKANPTIDYLPQLNALTGEVRPQDNAWSYYRMALRLAVLPRQEAGGELQFNFPPVGGVVLSPKQRAALADWISLNQLSWLQLDFGARKPLYRREFKQVRGNSLIVDCLNDPCLVNLRPLAMIGLWKARLALEQGRVDEAVDDCLTVIRVGAHLQTDPSLVEQLAALNVSTGGCREIIHLVATSDMSLDQLSALQKRLTGVYANGYPYVCYEGDRLNGLDLIQRAFTSGGPGGGHLVAEECAGDLVIIFCRANDPTGNQGAEPPGKGAITSMMPLGTMLSMMHASRKKTVQRINDIFDRMKEIAPLSPYQRLAGHIANPGEMPPGLAGWRYAVAYLAMPAEQRTSLLRFRAKSEYDAAVTIVALARYHKAGGAYPASLQALVDSGYLNCVPMDPFSDKPLVYKLTSSGFCLYSISENFTDDGGVQGKDRKDNPKAWQDNGDTIFWPVVSSSN